MHRRTLNLGILGLAGGLVGTAMVPSFAHAAVEVDLDAASQPRVLGDPDAPLTMIEYSSLTCPHCATFHAKSYKPIVETYVDTGKLKFEMRDFPLDQYALRASAMARAIDGKPYFALIDMLFKQQSSWTRAENPIDALKKIGRLAGISAETADAYMTDDALLDSILNGRIAAQKTYDVNSTPTFVIGDEVIRGAEPFETFQTVIEGKLA
ncbi:Protein-disulfide isomerase [Thalassobaculum litoreum DSM 18839]|uniref:Protein-disulfide isomerase n=2 Tax=Thalassobaculaceae TaxID=2844864 RepID=A0A8G2BMZ9_9PROT|nr:Protein-disulfide isomerase [Thalassobaculum litoreum DSM 18839]